MKNFTAFFIGMSLISSLGSAQSFTQLQWGLHNEGISQGIELDHITTFRVQARPGQDLQIPVGLAKSSKKIIVAVLDTGVDSSHPDLSGVLHRNESECKALEKFLACTETKDRKECEKIWMDFNNPEVDQDHNGYPLDCSGWSILGSVNSANILGRPDFGDDQGHGTHVAGIVGAQKNNGLGVDGVSSNIEILPVQVLGKKPNEPIKPLDTHSSGGVPPALIPPGKPGAPQIPPPQVVAVPPRLGQPGTGPIDLSPGEAGKEAFRQSLGDLVARGVIYAIRSGAQVINFSMGWPQANDSSYLRQVIAEAQKRGIVIVAAAGNDSTRALLRPCAYPGVICVAAHGPDGSLSHFSNYGSGVDIAAPGTNILSTWPLEKRPVRFRSTLGYEYLHGTSQASPFIAGVVGEMLAQGVPASEIFSRLVLGARDLKEKLPLLEGSLQDLRESQTPANNYLVEKKWILSGMADLTKALKVSQQALILPASKEKLEIIWNRKSSHLSFKFPFKNFWKDIDSSQVSVSGQWLNKTNKMIRPQITSLQFENSGGLWKTNEQRNLLVEMDITDAAVPAQSRISSDLDLDLQVQAGERRQRVVIESEITVPITQDLADSEMEILGIRNMPPLRTSLISIDKNYDQTVRTDYLALAVQNPANIYFLLRQDESGTYSPQGQIKVKLGEDLDRTREQMTTRINWSNSTDVGYVLGLLIDRSAVPKDDVFSALKILFLNSKFELQKTFEINNEKVQIPLKVSWMNYHGMKVPAWVGKGYDPDKKPSVREDWENPTGNERADTRFYFLDENGALKALQKYQDYRITDVLDASLAQVQAGRVPVILAKNRGSEVKPSYIYDFAIGEIINGEVQNFRPIDYSMDNRIYRNLLDTRVDQVLNLNEGLDSGRGTFWFGEGVSQSQRLSMLVNGGSGLKFYDSNLSAVRGRYDSTLWIRAAYMGSQGLGAFALTNSEIQYHDLSRKQVAVKSLERYTFYDDMVFTEIQFPITLKDSKQPGQMLPALFTVESTELSRGVKFKTTARDKEGNLVEITVPARLRFKSDRGCRALDNATVASDGAPSVDYYCGDRILRMKLNF